LAFAPQDDAAATYCRKLQKEDGVLDFAQPAKVLAARINGLFPWPGCVVPLQGQIVKVGLADVAAPALGAGPPAEGGTVLGQDAEGLLLAAGDGVLRLRRMQRPGGKMLAAADFLRGFPVMAGHRVPSHPMPELVSRR